MRYLLDTNICIYIANQRPMQVLERFNRTAPDEVAMSIVTYGELRFGAQKSDRPVLALKKLAEFNEAVPVLALGTEAAEHYGRLRWELQRQGKPIGSNDLWIAAHCLGLGMTLVTNNEREFIRIPNLPIENWTL